MSGDFRRINFTGRGARRQATEGLSELGIAMQDRMASRRGLRFVPGLIREVKLNSLHEAARRGGMGAS